MKLSKSASKTPRTWGRVRIATSAALGIVGGQTMAAYARFRPEM